MPIDALQPTLLSAKAGDFLTIDGETFALWSYCGARATPLACITCCVRLANEGQLDMHLEQNPNIVHRIAAKCERHGWEAVR